MNVFSTVQIFIGFAIQFLKSVMCPHGNKTKGRKKEKWQESILQLQEQLEWGQITGSPEITMESF